MFYFKAIGETDGHGERKQRQEGEEAPAKTMAQSENDLQ